jgi:hypothetical protein
MSKAQSRISSLESKYENAESSRKKEVEARSADSNMHRQQIQTRMDEVDASNIKLDRALQDLRTEQGMFYRCRNCDPMS